MSWELSYDTYICGVHSSELEREVEENQEYKRKIENEIFALILSDPAKVRNQRKKSKKDDDFDDDDYLNNPQYLTRLWEELKEQWESSMYKIIHCGDAQEAVKNDKREVDICPDCHCQIEWIKEEVKEEDSEYSRWTEVYKCPKCGKKYAHNADYNEENLPLPMTVTIKTWGEG